ncbi:MAG: phenylpropionate dioxygenase-like ring-hydroxylating dioxygenase large terminal subunit [Myxococcota bacterium]|jgi:phenylpropionate dioxygenase-like ring-hydroxylating dioxygenase large terminal subunit
MNPLPAAPTLDPRHRPPQITAGWYVLCQSHELRPGRLLKRQLHGRPLVLFRAADGRPATMLDRCPHRNVPLSRGHVVEGELQCSYHGWRFDRAGACTDIPGLVGEPAAPNRCARAYPTVEQQGFVWAWGEPGDAPESMPFRFDYADDPQYLTVRRSLPARGSLHMVAENALDVPHTAFVHGGLFRTDRDRSPISCVIQRWHDRVECEFVGEARPSGLAGRLLSPSGGEVVHHDRFFLPGIVQVEYRIGDENHLQLNGALTPVDDFHTVMHACVSLKSRVPGWLIRPIVQPLALYIFGQDQSVLGSQTDSIHAFGSMSYASSDIDVLGPHILKLMRRAERGQLGDSDAPPWRREVEMLM